jgi:hypothetical protein
VSHLQSGASAWRLVFDVLMIVLLTANRKEAWLNLKKQHPENSMDI